MQRMIMTIVILCFGITSGAWLPLGVALPISVITGWFAGCLLADCKRTKNEKSKI